MNILILESYDTGSHKQFLDGLTRHSTHRFTRLGLPGRTWKWRMRGSGIYFAQLLEKQPPQNTETIDLIFTSDMTPVADLKALLPPPLKKTPIVCYFHENQLTYPIPNELDRDYQYAFTNITSCLAAEAVWFNSKWHRNSFLTAVDALLKKMPDFVPPNITQTIQNRSTIMPLGLPDDLQNTPHLKINKTHPPTILWNHRWEYDKNPDDFFEAMFDLDRAGVDYRLIIAGEQFRNAPPIFQAAQKALSHRIDHFGYAPDRQAYLKLLDQADIVISTSIHEFFGLAVLEAIARNGYPLLPNRLSYPELIPKEVHPHHIYSDNHDMTAKLVSLCKYGIPTLAPALTKRVETLCWNTQVKQYDQAFSGFQATV